MCINQRLMLDLVRSFARPGNRIDAHRYKWIDAQAQALINASVQALINAQAQSLIDARA